MRICCDQNVASKYVETFERTQWTSTTVASALDPEASDAEIASFARTNDWVVFTSDDDFYVHADSHGLLVYSQVEDPEPGVVREAIAAYDRPADVTEFVPDGWI